MSGGGDDDNGDHDDAYDDDSTDADDDAIGMGGRRHHRVARASLHQIALGGRQTVTCVGAPHRVRSKNVESWRARGAIAQSPQPC